LLYRDTDGFHPDSVEEDQSIVVDIKDKGLVIVSGCAHSGILNTIRHARAISGVDRVWAVMGGFHLMSAADTDVQQTIDGMKALSPVVVAPSHCTGFGAVCAFAHQMPEAFVHTVSGTTFTF
jgi:7,8-dihydropterin-6-yl-methyl-4-(beta-D-ribofuranosyl)aminobenzene 5'-phosphate synthase